MWQTSKTHKCFYNRLCTSITSFRAFSITTSEGSFFLRFLRPHVTKRFSTRYRNWLLSLTPLARVRASKEEDTRKSCSILSFWPTCITWIPNLKKCIIFLSNSVSTKQIDWWRLPNKSSSLIWLQDTSLCQESRHIAQQNTGTSSWCNYRNMALKIWRQQTYGSPRFFKMYFCTWVLMVLARWLSGICYPKSFLIMQTRLLAFAIMQWDQRAISILPKNSAQITLNFWRSYCGEKSSSMSTFLMHRVTMVLSKSLLNHCMEHWTRYLITGKSWTNYFRLNCPKASYSICLRNLTRVELFFWITYKHWSTLRSTTKLWLLSKRIAATYRWNRASLVVMSPIF